MMLFDEAETRTSIRGYLDSHEWWMFLALDGVGNSWVERIEEEFYTGDKGENGDFHLIIGPLPGFSSIAFGKKERAAREGLETFMGNPIPEGLDVLGMGDEHVFSSEYADRIESLNNWLFPNNEGHL
jgi:hypothetical protein